MLVCNLQCSPQSSSSNSTSSQVEFVEFPIILLGNLLLVDMDGLGPVVLTNVTSTTTEPATGCSEFDSLRTEEEWYPQTFSLWQKPTPNIPSTNERCGQVGHLLLEKWQPLPCQKFFCLWVCIAKFKFQDDCQGRTKRIS